MINGQTTGVEEKLQAAEAALAASASGFEQSSQPDAETRNLIGIIATARATLAVAHYDPERMMAQAHRALAYLAPENLAFRTSLPGF